ncbi:MAG: DUF177 domain-containing protein [Alphaproteobacteria bacterium]|nr:DUF177 domain-containing protein [Alphaproteobacteria bacterium]
MLNHKINVNSISNTAKILKIKANAEELLNLAAQTEVLKFNLLEGEVSITRNLNRFAVLGEIKAEFIQADAVSLEEIDASIFLPIKRIYEKTARIENSKKIKNVVMNFDKEEDDIDTLENDTIDVGFIILEELILNIDPFARKE